MIFHKIKIFRVDINISIEFLFFDVVNPLCWQIILTCGVQFVNTASWLIGSTTSKIRIQYLILSPTEEGNNPSYDKNLTPLHPRMICANLVDIGPVIMEKLIKMWIITKQALTQ